MFLIFVHLLILGFQYVMVLSESNNNVASFFPLLIPFISFLLSNYICQHVQINVKRNLY